MACSRTIRGRVPLVMAGFGLMALAVLTSLVALSNGIVAGRRSVQTLRADRAYLETRLGMLEEDWNRETAQGVIVSRARRELRLVPPDGPGTVVVRADPRGEKEAPVWRRLLTRVADGGRVAVARAGEVAR